MKALKIVLALVLLTPCLVFAYEVNTHEKISEIAYENSMLVYGDHERLKLFGIAKDDTTYLEVLLVKKRRFYL